MERRRLLIRFLTTALPTRLDTANPNRVSPPRVSAATAAMEKSLLRARLPYLKTRRNSGGRRKRRFLGSPINSVLV